MMISTLLEARKSILYPGSHQMINLQDLYGFRCQVLTSPDTELPDLNDAAIIREVHVYGQSLEVGEFKDGAAQHAGLGTQLLEKADGIARSRGFRRIAVISAVGTRLYYLNRGYQRGKYYLVKDL